MKLTASIRCSSCGLSQNLEITLPFSCEDIACPKCREYAMSITYMQDLPRPAERSGVIGERINDLYKIRRL